MISITKEFKFEAAHQLKHHDGKCRRLHGHSWVARITVVGHSGMIEANGPKKGMLMDFGVLKNTVNPLVEDYLDHHDLNATLKTDSPTSEFVAVWLYGEVRKTLDNVGYKKMGLVVEVDETCTSSCKFDPLPVIA